MRGAGYRFSRSARCHCPVDQNPMVLGCSGRGRSARTAYASSCRPWKAIVYARLDQLQSLRSAPRRCLRTAALAERARASRFDQRPRGRARVSTSGLRRCRRRSQPAILDVASDDVALAARRCRLERNAAGTAQQPIERCRSASEIVSGAVSRPAGDSLATVLLVRGACSWRRVFALHSLILGLTAAGFCRIGAATETAAERIAGGDFGSPIRDHGNDEIGESLERSFERVQLAQLDNARKEFVAMRHTSSPAASFDRRLTRTAARRTGQETRAASDTMLAGSPSREALDRSSRPLTGRRRSARVVR